MFKVKMADASGAVEENVPNQEQASVVAPPKFVFGQSMAERVKEADTTKSDDHSIKDDAKNESEITEENRTAKKRPADNDDTKEVTADKESDSEHQEEGTLSPVKKVAKIFNWSGQDEEDEPKQFKLKPSILTEVAKNLKGTSKTATEESDNTASSLPKTFGMSSTSESTSTETRTTPSAPEPLAGSTKNYFQMFLDKNHESLEKQKAGSFVFGCNMSDRVTFVSQSEEDKDESKTEDDKQKSEETTSTHHESTQDHRQTLQEVAKSCADKDGPQSPTTSPDKHHLSLAEAAKVYEDAAGPSQSKFEQVEVVTGEEEERNVLKINCRLFMFDVEKHNWREKGRGFLRLNDMCKSMSDSTFQSRLVMRTQGHLRVTLNTKLWPAMTLEKANEKSLRITGFDSENEVKIYLIMAGPKDIQQLYTAIDRRIQALKHNKEEHGTTESDQKLNNTTEQQDGDESKKETNQDKSKNSLTVNQKNIGDESSNDSCPIRSKDSFSDDE